MLRYETTYCAKGHTPHGQSIEGVKILKTYGTKGCTPRRLSTEDVKILNNLLC